MVSGNDAFGSGFPFPVIVGIRMSLVAETLFDPADQMPFSQACIHLVTGLYLPVRAHDASIVAAAEDGVAARQGGKWTDGIERTAQFGELMAALLEVSVQAVSHALP